MIQPLITPDDLKLLLFAVAAIFLVACLITSLGLYLRDGSKNARTAAKRRHPSGGWRS